MKKYIKLMLLVAAISVGIAGGFFLYQHNTAIQKQMAVQKEAERIKFVAAKLKTVKITSSLDGAVQNAYYYRTHSNEKRPLIVMLHTWCGTYKSLHEANSPIPPQQVFTLDWNYIQPDFRGKNDHPDACGSEKTVRDIDQAIDYAVSQGNVDTNKIYIVGASGGAYQGLVYFMKSKKQVAGYELWVPVSDLIAFYYQGMSQRHSYDGDILKCTSSEGDMLNFD